ncbi:MAG: alkaline phosphatase family protein [Anaerolineae bacterium]|nr:alkaline phosphatase family protein [Anaerolineae bacterium]
MRILFLFLDGVGLGADDPAINPLAAVPLPHLSALLGGHRLTAAVAPIETARATLLALDACLGVAGTPQSATGQATLLTGRNVPGEIGYHYGPKPNEAVAAYLRNGNLFRTLCAAGRRVTFLNAYPPAYFEAIRSGRRLYSAIPLAVTNAGLPLKTAADLYAGQALAADFTGRGWRERLNLHDAPVLTPTQAGRRMAELAARHDFSFFEYWPSDYAGHHQDWDEARTLLSDLDAVLGGLVAAWDDEAGLILITSDHGNLEDLGTRGHTANPVPALVIGAAPARRAFCARLRTLADVAPAILAAL